MGLVRGVESVPSSAVAVTAGSDGAAGDADATPSGTGRLAAGGADNGLRAALGGWHTRNGHFQPHEDFMR